MCCEKKSNNIRTGGVTSRHPTTLSLSIFLKQEMKQLLCHSLLISVWLVQNNSSKVLHVFLFPVAQDVTHHPDLVSTLADHQGSSWKKAHAKTNNGSGSSLQSTSRRLHQSFLHVRAPGVPLSLSWRGVEAASPPLLVCQCCWCWNGARAPWNPHSPTPILILNDNVVNTAVAYLLRHSKFKKKKKKGKKRVIFLKVKWASWLQL